jgi:hypothetical protein
LHAYISVAVSSIIIKNALDGRQLSYFFVQKNIKEKAFENAEKSDLYYLIFAYVCTSEKRHLYDFSQKSNCQTEDKSDQNNVNR